ncbi:methionine adenosyltransferase [Sphingopyxis sp. GW247-27LB]|uniref:methionine adenosyltransferase n=1 Tax=Sphingopyxis sp. GW247-27LB TaxID=2012632 RepID=UPI000BA51264|nr:methionine adenosyltransferase [Sphingopyxis sp. GW247-27LB]PAL19772.1 S-adenosylmethionine synthase [Sphingopyxis sp. GW247-27LB]
MTVAVTTIGEASGDLLPLEIVERKGLGHPDTICDHLTEALSQELSRSYREIYGHTLHYNVDKALLWGGSSDPRFGGGRISQPMEVYLAGRAIVDAAGRHLPLDDLVKEVVRRWFARYFPLLDLDRHLRTHCLVRPGSADLASLFERHGDGAPAMANDTSIGVGFAPLSSLERVVLDAEHRLGEMACGDIPAIGRDIKIMGIRQGRKARIVVACALVDRHIPDLQAYLSTKADIAEIVRSVACAEDLDADVLVNTADDPDAGSLYLTVLGTSAECGDDGQAGRGNRINGLITPFRPTTIESVPGKNAVSHVGKLYNIAAGLIADRVARLDGVAEAQCLLVSEIGHPVTEPLTVNVRLRLSDAGNVKDYQAAVSAIVEQELELLAGTDLALANGSVAIGNWPLRRADSDPLSSRNTPHRNS